MNRSFSRMQLSFSRSRVLVYKLAGTLPYLQFCRSAVGECVATSEPSVYSVEGRMDTETEVLFRTPSERAAATSPSSCTIFRIYCSRIGPGVSCRRSYKPSVSSARRTVAPAPVSSKLEPANRHSLRSLSSRSCHLQS